MDNILYYNENSEYCLIFIKMLKDNNKYDMFKLERVELTNNLPKIKINDINEPLYGIDAINWLETIKYFNHETNNINKQNNIINVNKDNDETNNIKNMIKIKKCANIDDEEDKKIVGYVDINDTSTIINNGDNLNINKQIKETRFSSNDALMRLQNMARLHKQLKK